ncbi:helix-turn-helix domain-containing protein [Chryseobacterium shigense]|uniref:AraC-like DNA-binding protein/Tfp pilus assembly protein PilF n=1 Tax=Chryseobacterium shigense TaxID=297244 RepID=A0A841NH39_9FLAO|nr:helix-turn-helix domain-containing protein [Chryseobacterium shigense]MBB6370629.1 AraC-like DNA-binding protein/Tfp pilus assembly protein PilF [Chryseobacterium shigense]
MSKSLLKLLFLFITAVPILAQKKYNFDQICERTFVQIAQKDIPKALKTADSLYMKAQKPLDKVKSLLLSAELYHSAGEFKKSVCYGENAHSLLSQVNDAEWFSRVNEFLAKEYRLVGLFERSKKYTLQGMEAAKHIRDTQKRGEVVGLLNQEMAYYEIEQGSYPEAVKYIELSLNSFGQDDIQGNIRAVAASYQLLGDVYFKLKDYTASENYYRKAESMLKNRCCILGLVYNGLGGIRLKQKNWKDAEFYLKKAENIADSSRSLKLKKAVYSNINDYYEGTGDNFKASLYAVKYVKAYDSLTARNREFTFKSPEIPKPNKKNARISIVKNAAIIILAGALIMIVIFFRIKQKKQRAKFRNIIRTQFRMSSPGSGSSPLKTAHSDFSNISVEEVDDRAEEADKPRNESLMTSETECKLLDLLEEFEKGELYNNKNMSLSFLAAELNTNTKYLSYVINRHKSSDVKTYVNRLRINYIVDKLINDDKYRQYKISILADECGFSSHSKFASVFKAVTDFSPSAYIKYLDTENQSGKNIHFQENN